VPKVNQLKRLIREKQAEHKRQTGKHLPQNVIAVALGIDPATLSLYMNDKTGSISWETWQNLSNYLGVSGDEIFNVKPDEEA
jgi:transcriptional regulator with XRE-family HTH domain